jgi:DNA-binding GntR family transcriptional regulator
MDQANSAVRGFQETKRTSMAMPGSVFALKLKELSTALGERTLISDRIANTLRSMIVAGQLNPGDRIVEFRVAKELGVGQPTVREALVALEHQGLVVRKLNQGCVVTTLSRDEISQMLRIRAELEVLAVELAAEVASKRSIQELKERVKEMKEAGQRRDIEAFFERDFQFHEALWRLSGNTFIPKILSQVTVPLLAFLFIRNVRNHHLSFDMEASAQAHMEIVNAILSREKKTVRSVTREKLQMFADQHLHLYEK